MSKLEKLKKRELSSIEYRNTLGGRKPPQPSDRGYSVIVTCDKGANSDTFTVYYLDGRVQQTEYDDTNSIQLSDTLKTQR